MTESMSGLSAMSQDAWDNGTSCAPAGGTNGSTALDAAALAQLTEAVSRQTSRYADVESETLAQRQHIARLEEMLHQQVSLARSHVRSKRHQFIVV
jgi:hypothetical protein